MLEKVPAVLKTHPQWVLWQLGTKVPLQCNSANASVNNPATWCSFDNAVETYTKYGQNPANKIGGVGFVLGYAARVLGLDIDKVWDKEGQLLFPLALKVANAFNSYTEVSPSGTGLHVLFTATLDKSRRHNGFELYAGNRFFTVTGNSYGEPRPLNDATKQATDLAANIDKQRGKGVYAPSINMLAEAKWSDDQILAIAGAASNAELFNALYYQGDIELYNGDQSRADQALINLLQFYSQSPPQIVRMFRASALGQRPKASRDDYILNTIKNSFDMTPQTAVIPELPVQYTVKPAPLQPKPENQLGDSREVFTLPPGGGIIGEIAKYIYDQSPIPMVEAALGGALALMAGICGRQYQCNGSGLNLYLMLLARTGSGKEAVSTGIGAIMDAIVKGKTTVDGQPLTLQDAPYPAAAKFRGPARVTGQGLTDVLRESSELSLFCIFNEFANTMQQMADPKANIGIKDLNDALLDLYMKSKKGNVYAGRRTADPKKKVEFIDSPAFTFIAECTPKILYKGLTEDMISSGLLPRMLIFESKDINDLREEFNLEPPAHVVSHVRAQMKLVTELKTNGDRRIEVMPADQAALDLYKEMRVYAHNMKKGAGDDEVQAQLWNRAHLNVVRIASIVAIGCNPTAPMFTVDQLNWAWRIVSRAISMLHGKFERGEVGEIIVQDDLQQEVILKLIEEWKGYDPAKMPGALAKDQAAIEARHAGFIPMTFLSRRVSQVGCFSKDKRGKSAALDRAIATAIKHGDLINVPMDGRKPGAYYKLT